MCMYHIILLEYCNCYVMGVYASIILCNRDMRVSISIQLNI